MKEKITFLGTGTSQGIPVIGCQCEVCRSDDTRDKRLRSSVLIETGDTTILIDAGTDLRQQLLRNHTITIDAILITHEHKDHIGGIDDIRPINFMMKKTMNIYGMKRVLHVIEKDFDYAFKEHKYPGVPNLKLIPVYENPFHINDIEVIPIHVQHCALPILGYRIKDIAYITDASFISNKEKQKLQNLEILVINALRIQKHYSHFNLAQALAIIEELKPKRAFFTHISHEMGKYADIAPTLPRNVFLGVDGLEVEV